LRCGASRGINIGAPRASYARRVSSAGVSVSWHEAAASKAAAARRDENIINQAYRENGGSVTGSVRSLVVRMTSTRVASVATHGA